MNVICLEEKAFYALIEDVLDRMRERDESKKAKWISGGEAMKFLNIKSKTTLQKLRDEGKIRYSQPDKRIILYDVNSLYAYLDENAKNPF